MGQKGSKKVFLRFEWHLKTFVFGHICVQIIEAICPSVCNKNAHFWGYSVRVVHGTGKVCYGLEKMINSFGKHLKTGKVA